MPLLNAQGKPVASEDIYIVEINVYHKPSMNGTGRKIPVLKAQVDGNMHVISGVLQAAMQRTMDVLIKIGAVRK